MTDKPLELDPVSLGELHELLTGYLESRPSSALVKVLTVPGDLKPDPDPVVHDGSLTAVIKDVFFEDGVLYVCTY